MNVMMPLEDEGTPVWRPVEARLLRDGRYEILGPVPDDEVWRYPPGTIVHCEVRQFEVGDRLVAVSRA